MASSGASPSYGYGVLLSTFLTWQVVPLLNRAVEGCEAALGRHDAITLATTCNLGMVYRELGQRENAEAMLRRAAQGMGETLGPQHPRTLRASIGLALLLERQGRSQEAAVLYRGRGQVPGRQRSTTLDDVRRLVALLHDRKADDEAAQLALRFGICELEPKAPVVQRNTGDRAGFGDARNPAGRRDKSPGRARSPGRRA